MGKEKRLCLVLREIKDDAESRREYDNRLLLFGFNNNNKLLLPEIEVKGEVMEACLICIVLRAFPVDYSAEVHRIWSILCCYCSSLSVAFCMAVRAYHAVLYKWPSQL